MEKIIVLEDSFDPNELPPGYYTAYSDTEAYPTLWAMVNTGFARDEGVRFLEGGVVQMLASLEVHPLNPNPEDEYEEAMVVIPHSSFTKVINDYGNWRQVWWREVIQNAIDARATKIDCRIEEREDGSWVASCRDNGGGMSYDTLMNAFFTVGGTEKHGYSQGGFGEAKKLIALAWVSYSIHTRDIRVEGTGAEFPKLRLYRNVENIDGTKVEVVMPADKHTTEAAAIEYISRCQLPGVKFFVNGVPVQANLRRGTKKRDLPDGAELFYNKEVDGIHALLVRSNGLYMFDQELSSDFKGVIVVEVHPRPKSEGGPTVEHLFLSSRMGLQYGSLRDAVSKVYSQAEFDIKQALRDPDALFRKKYEGRGYFTTETARNREAMVREQAGPLPESSGGGSLEMTGDMLTELVRMFGDFERRSVDEASGDAARMVAVVSPEEADIMLRVGFKGESHLEAGIKQMVWQPNFMNLNDETTRDGFVLDKKFEPANMTGPVFSVARLWAAFVRFILIKMGSEETWGVGFVFSKEAQGMFYRDDDGGEWITINPTNLKTGKLLSIREKDDVRLMFEVAMHECSHLLGGTYHGDAFVNALDRIVTEMLQYWSEAKKIAKSIKIRGAVKKQHQQEAPATTLLEVYPMTAAIAYVSVSDIKSKKSISESLGIGERELSFFLQGDELDDFLWKADSEARDMWTKGSMFITTVSYQLARKLVSRSIKEGEKIEPSRSIPIRVIVTNDGLLYVEPADQLNKNYYSEYFRGVSDASLRVPVTGIVAESDDLIKKLFLDNYELRGWPYVETKTGPAHFIRKLYIDGSVIVPVEPSIYFRAAAQEYDYSFYNMVKAKKIDVNVGVAHDGFYIIHPQDGNLYEVYRKRFDTGDEFRLRLSSDREKFMIESLMASWNKIDIDNGFTTSVSVPTKLFEKWLYDNELSVRRKDWYPVTTDGVMFAASNQITAIARNLGKNIILFEFSSPYDWGDRVSIRYRVSPSDLSWYVPAENFNDAVQGVLDNDQRSKLKKFWKEYSPGTFLFNMDGDDFEDGVSKQFKVSVLKPSGAIPVWLFVLDDESVMIKPVLESHKRWVSEQTGKDAVIVLQHTGPEAAQKILQSTYNCGTTPDGLEIAQHQYSLLYDQKRPVLAAILTSSFVDMVTES